MPQGWIRFAPSSSKLWIFRAFLVDTIKRSQLRLFRHLVRKSWGNMFLSVSASGRKSSEVQYVWVISQSESGSIKLKATIWLINWMEHNLKKCWMCLLLKSDWLTKIILDIFKLELFSYLILLYCDVENNKSFCFTTFIISLESLITHSWSIAFFLSISEQGRQMVLNY